MCHTVYLQQSPDGGLDLHTFLLGSLTLCNAACLNSIGGKWFPTILLLPWTGTFHLETRCGLTVFLWAPAVLCISLCNTILSPGSPNWFFYTLHSTRVTWEQRLLMSGAPGFILEPGTYEQMSEVSRHPGKGHDKCLSQEHPCCACHHALSSCSVS